MVDMVFKPKQRPLCIPSCMDFDAQGHGKRGPKKLPNEPKLAPPPLTGSGHQGHLQGRDFSERKYLPPLPSRQGSSRHTRVPCDCDAIAFKGGLALAEMEWKRRETVNLEQPAGASWRMPEYIGRRLNRSRVHMAMASSTRHT